VAAAVAHEEEPRAGGEDLFDRDVPPLLFVGRPLGAVLGGAVAGVDLDGGLVVRVVLVPGGVFDGVVGEGQDVFGVADPSPELA
jgi:hypothetical protein